MSLFQKILADITKKINSNKEYKEDIAQKLSTITGIPIKDTQIEVKNGVLFISVSPTIKSVIRLKQQDILRLVKEYNITTIG